MKDWKKNWWNPLWYVGAVLETVFSVIGGILRFFGFNMPQPKMQHENIQVDDIDRAYNDAAAAENLADFAPEIDQRMRDFQRYVASNPSERASFDLQVFDAPLQDFILGLSEDDIDELRRRGPVGQLQAALIGRIPPGMEMKAAPESIPEPSKADLVRARFLSAIGRRAQDDTELAVLDYAPGR